jgi:phospho-N-acetylmuramoyl-pentapeptide-transferase
MGGMAFAVVLLGSCFLSVIAPSISFPLFTYQLPAALYVQAVVFCAFAAIGLCDDLYKRWYRKGITERQKSLAQIAVSMACATFLWYGAGFTSVCIPLINYSVPLGILYVPYAAFIMIATSNAVNITDGIDGLAASALFPTFFAGIAVACLLKMAALAWGCSATCGALFAFFLFNRHPAKLFMGDVGSLGLGGLLAWCFLVMRTELLLPLLALVPVIETVSVMVQVAVYKKTGKRVLRMAPLHHHLELLGWSEWKIVGVAALLSVLAALAGWLIIRAS